jgi:hypothetical protein
MKINQTRIHNVDDYLQAIEEDATYRVIFELEPAQKELILNRIGFPIPTLNHYTMLPAIIGPVTRFNAEGKWTLNREMPKEKRYIRTVRWRWKQWVGRDQTEEKEEERDIYRECYARDYTMPPAVEVTFTQYQGIDLIISPILVNTTEDKVKAKHVINLFLELFGTCELRHNDLKEFVTLKTHRVNWQMLPPGEYPWQRLEEYVSCMIRHTSQSTQEVILDRQKTLCDYGAKTCYIGLGGFLVYVAYIFEEQNIVVMESVRKDNAIYVFDHNWQEFAKLTKSEVLNNKYHKYRIIHAKGWKEKLKNILKIEKKVAA